MMKKLSVLAVCLALIACQDNGSGTAAPGAETPVEAKPAATAPKASDAAATGSKEQPQLLIETFDGKTFDLSSHRGKWVVVNFWATWCAPCLKEIPDFNALAKKRGDIQFIGLAYEEIERPDLEAFLKRHPIDYPIAVLNVYEPPKDFDTPRGLPMTVLIGPEGKRVKQFLGPVTSAELEAEMAKAGAQDQ
jgi:thiol-disulfide isomerase/thioredoxin